MTSSKYSIGDVFLVRDIHGADVACCLVVAVSGDGVCIGSFYPAQFCASIFRDSDVVAGKLRMFGDLHILSGQWPKTSCRIGAEKLPPEFIFCRRTLFGENWLARYDRSAKLVSQVRVSDPAEIAGVPQEGLLGAGAAENWARKEFIN